MLKTKFQGQTSETCWDRLNSFKTSQLEICLECRCNCAPAPVLAKEKNKKNNTQTNKIISKGSVSFVFVFAVLISLKFKQKCRNNRPQLRWDCYPESHWWKSGLLAETWYFQCHQRPLRNGTPDVVKTAPVSPSPKKLAWCWRKPSRIVISPVSSSVFFSKVLLAFHSAAHIQGSDKNTSST